MKRTYKGFTLIELLVVIAIIGLLSTLAVVALNSARQRSRDAKRVADIRQIQTALELGFSEASKYPVTPTGSVLGATATIKLCNNSGSPVFTTSGGTCSGTVYMGLVPSNPSPNGGNYTYAATPSGCDNSSTSCSSYSLLFSLEGATGQLGSGSNCANPAGIQAGTSC